MKSLVVFVSLISLVACGRGGFQTRSSDAYYQTDSELDAYYPDDESSKDDSEQLEFDFDEGQQQTKDNSEQAESDQPELPLDPPSDSSNTIDGTTDEEAPKQTDEPEYKGEPDPKDHHGDERSSGSSNLVPTSSEMSSAALLKPTIYYLPTNKVDPFRSCSSDDIRSFRALGGRDLVPGKREIRVCSKFYFAVQMEGSGLIRARDGREFLINYVGVEGGIPRFKVVDRNVCPYGLGKDNLCLQPFISIAADRNRYAVGDVIYVPAVAKARIRLPDGDIHRGFFIVSDTGAAITGLGRFDFYTGPFREQSSHNPFKQLGLGSKSNASKMIYYRVKRDSQTQQKVLKYYKGRQIIPYRS